MVTQTNVVKHLCGLMSHHLPLKAGEKIPLHEPEFIGIEKKLINECIDTGWVSSVGAFVSDFETDLKKYTGMKHAVAMVNGTAALHLALLTCGVAADKEVLLPSMTFVATANAIKYCGGIPHFIDVNSIGAVDFQALESYLDQIAELRDGRCVNKESGRTIQAIVVMHMLGHPLPMENCVQIGKKWNLKIIEDAAEAMGSLWHEKHVGHLSDVAVISFNGNKTITTGGGGVLLTNKSKIGSKARHLSTTARVSSFEFEHDDVAFNYRMPNINAAIGVAQLKNIEDKIQRKREIFSNYNQMFADFYEVGLIKEPVGARSNYWLNALILAPSVESQREEAINALQAKGYLVRPAWKPMHTLPMFKGCPAMDMAGVNTIWRRLILLPSSPQLNNRFIK